MNEATPYQFALDGRNALITGARGGLGRTLVSSFLKAGANVAMHNGRTPATQYDLDILAVPGRKLEAFHGDLTHSGACSELLNELQEVMQSPDILINCAADQSSGMLAEQEQRDWNRISQANVTAVFALSRCVIDRQKNGGAIVNVSSIEALRPNQNHAAYAASKAALVSLTKSLALEFGTAGWRTNAVAPGLIHRDGIEHQWPEGVARWCNATPMKRLVDPAEVAAACIFLTSSAASGISGSLLPVDCGFLSAPGW